MTNNHLESCTPGTRQYKVVRTGTYQYILFWIRGGTRNVKIVHTSTYRYVRTHDISMAVHTGMYWYVLYGTRRYKEVQPSTRRYMVVQGTVQGGTRQYVLVCTGMYEYLAYGSNRLGYAALRLNSLLQFCPADSAVLETSASYDSNASSSMFQSVDVKDCCVQQIYGFAEIS